MNELCHLLTAMGLLLADAGASEAAAHGNGPEPEVIERHRARMHRAPDKRGESRPTNARAPGRFRPIQPGKPSLATRPSGQHRPSSKSSKAKSGKRSKKRTGSKKRPTTPPPTVAPTTSLVPTFDLVFEPTASPVPTTDTPPPAEACTDDGKRRCCYAKCYGFQNFREKYQSDRDRDKVYEGRGLGEDEGTETEVYEGRELAGHIPEECAAGEVDDAETHCECLHCNVDSCPRCPWPIL